MSMSNFYHALRQLKNDKSFGEGDVLVLFGELFSRGYATGLVEEAEKRGMLIVRSTVGRRDADGSLRALNEDEVRQQPRPFINIPLEAGFDLEPDQQGKSPVDYLKEVRLSEWESVQIEKSSLQESQRKGRERFQKHLRSWVTELQSHIPEGKNVLFAHLMAGGVPRVKIVMPLMNRSLKGSGERFLSSEKFWQSGIGQICAQNFLEVTAETFANLITETSSLRLRQETHGAKVRYLAYGYHGTEVLVGQNYLWQSYSPYLQGWAKMRLENYARDFTEKGIHCCVYNCPEILTNSSAIFNGVEVSLYPLMGALRKEGPESPRVKALLEKCQSYLKPEHSIEEIIQYTQKYLMSDVIRAHCDFEKWPQHNSREQLEKMLDSSNHLVEMHKDTKNLITFLLSEVVFEGCGGAMIRDIANPEAPVSWINHDLVAKCYL